MEVDSTNWKSQATANITKYVHRGGECKGDEPELIGGSDLLNTIGIAMGLPPSNPDNWTRSETERAMRGELVFYASTDLEAINVVANQIRLYCRGDDKNFITVLPIELYHEGKLYEIPLFRIKRHVNSKVYYIDNIGRCYRSYDDWYENNKLPPGEMAYPTSLKLSLQSGSKDAKVMFGYTPTFASMNWKSQATSNITKYVHRGGECKGDEPELIGGSDLLNTIGIAMGLPPSNPDNWTRSETERAMRGELVFYASTDLEAINVVANQIRLYCGGDDKNFITVLPIELYHEGKLYEIPLFRIKRHVNSKVYYIDNIGRCYRSYDDWYENNKLPPGEMAYPTSLKLSLQSGSKDAKVMFGYTPTFASMNWKSQATSNITKYVHRGGECKGDEPQLIGGSVLLNTIGHAMGLPTSNPDNWTKSQKERAERGELVFYEGTALEAINVVANQIRSYCGGDDKNFITVLPIELYYEGKLYEVPLFKIKRHVNSKVYFIDNIGRCYRSYLDWNEFNKLPPGEMAYPTRLILSLKSGSKDAKVTFDYTPTSSLDAKAARGIDTVAGVAALGSSVGLLFVSGGLATPLVITSLVTAGWGTARAGYQIAEKAAHGESVDPLSNSESRMLWLGIAANLTNFAAMGASRRLSSLALRGRNISKAFKVFVDVANGANVTVSGLAILNTSIFMYNHREDLTAVDMLMFGAAVAFWSKGVFSCKSANTIIKETQNYAFAHIYEQLIPEQASEMAIVRSRFGDDAVLIRGCFEAMELNISVKDYSQLLIDGMKYSDIVSNFSEEQIKAFNSFSTYLRDDIKLINGIKNVSIHYNLNPRKTIENIINAWKGSDGSSQIVPTSSDTMLKDGNLLLGRAPPIKIPDLPQLSPPMIRFIGDLSQMDVKNSQWSSSVPILLSLQKQGLFTLCPVARIVSGGNAVLSLNSVLNISIHKLNSMPTDDCKNLLQLVGKLPSTVTSNQLPKEVKTLCVVKHRLRLECQRNESITTAAKFLENYKSLENIVKSNNLMSHEKDRLYTFVNTIALNKADLYKDDMLAFVDVMKPTNVNELVAYSEFVMNTITDECVEIKKNFHKGTIRVVLPENEKLSVWSRKEARKSVFGDRTLLSRNFTSTLQMVRDNKMVGLTKVASGMSDVDLIKVIRKENIKFANEVSATYHAAKHPTKPPEDYVALANKTIHDGAPRVAVGQDGEVRTITFNDGAWSAMVLERDGTVLLCTYMLNK